ncbi:HAMP domain-containing protein [Nannocystis pusilla]|uniref:HAMP domain-containing protein n=1 Tax=Nannocystis pusilla TaxID=889268 RepID=UPI003B766B4A
MSRVTLPRSLAEAPELRPLLDILRSLDPSRRLPAGEPGAIGELYAALNELLDQNRRLTRDLDRARAEVARVGGITPSDRVDSMVLNLGMQMRALADVVVAVTEGDLTRSIPGDARGQFGELAHSIGLLIANLRDTTRKNNEQDWLKTNLARITRLLQGYRDRAQLAALVLRELTPLVRAQLGLFYVVEGGESGDEPRFLRLVSSWAAPAELGREVVRLGEGLVGQCALEQRQILLTDIPPATCGSAPASATPTRATSSSSRSPSRASSRRSSSSPPSTPSATSSSPSSTSSPTRSASSSTPSPPAPAPSSCSPSRSRSPRSCEASSASSPPPTAGSSSRRSPCRPARSACACSKRSCSRRTASSRSGPSCCSSRTSRSSATTGRSSAPSSTSRSGRSSSSCPRSTSPSSSPTCRTSCARR